MRDSHIQRQQSATSFVLTSQTNILEMECSEKILANMYPTKGNTGQDLSFIFQAGDERSLENRT